MYLQKKINTWFGTRCRLINLQKAITISLISFLPTIHGYAQPANKYYPVQMSQFMYGYPFINPSSMGVNANYELFMGYQRPVTGFTGISTYYCMVSFIPYRIKASARNKNLTGLRFLNDNEGAYINRMRFYGMYAFHTKFSNRISFSGGVDFGGMNFAVKATPTTEGASVFKADANAGIWLYNSRFHAGLSVNQLFNSVFQPIDERTVLPTHINLTGSYAVISNDKFELRPHLLLTFPYYSRTSVQVGLHGLILNTLIASVSWNYDVNFSAMVGVNDLAVYKTRLHIIISYVTGTQQAALNINKLEATVVCFF